MPLQFLEVGFHVEIHAIEWHDFERDTQFHGVVVARIEFSLKNIMLHFGSAISSQFLFLFFLFAYFFLMMEPYNLHIYGKELFTNNF